MDTPAQAETSEEPQNPAKNAHPRVVSRENEKLGHVCCVFVLFGFPRRSDSPLADSVWMMSSFEPSGLE